MANRNDWQSSKDMACANLFMLENKLMTDVRLLFPAKLWRKEKVIEAHKYMLVSRSSVFSTIFNDSPNKKEIVINDIDPKTFRDFLKFLYTNEIDLDQDNMVPLFYAAKKYHVLSLITECRKHLKNFISKDSVATIFDHAVLLEDNALQAECIDFLKKSSKCSFESLQHVSYETLDILLSGEEGICESHDLLAYCMKWCKKECKKRGKALTMENQRAVLGPLLYKLAIHTLTFDDMESVRPKGISIFEDELGTYSFFTALIAEDETRKPILPEAVFNLLFASKQHSIATLNKICRNYLERNIDEIKVAFILDIAVIFDEKYVQAKCMDFLKKGTESSFKCLKRHHASYSTVEMLVTHEEMICEEQDLFVYCVNWSKEECKRQRKAITVENQRAELGPLLYKLHLPTLSDTLFDSVVTPSGMLTEEEVKSIKQSSMTEEEEKSIEQSKDGSLFPAVSRRAPFETVEIIEKSCHDQSVTWQLLGFTAAGQITTFINILVEDTKMQVTPKDNRFYFQEDYFIKLSSRCMKIWAVWQNTGTKLEFTSLSPVPTGEGQEVFLCDFDKPQFGVAQREKDASREEERQKSESSIVDQQRSCLSVYKTSLLDLGEVERGEEEVWELERNIDLSFPGPLFRFSNMNPYVNGLILQRLQHTSSL